MNLPKAPKPKLQVFVVEPEWPQPERMEPKHLTLQDTWVVFRDLEGPPEPV